MSIDKLSHTISCVNHFLVENYKCDKNTTCCIYATVIGKAMDLI